MIRLSVFAFTVFLAMIIGGPADAQPQAEIPERINAPAGVKLHLTGTDVLQDGAGTLYGRTRGPSDRGEIVWRVDGDRSVIVLEPGPNDAFGNGSLEVLNGMGYLVSVTRDQQQVSLFAIPGFVRLP